MINILPAQRLRILSKGKSLLVQGTVCLLSTTLSLRKYYESVRIKGPLELVIINYKQSSSSPLGKPSPLWLLNPWGGASEINTQIFAASSLQLSLSTWCKASATASGPSPPPFALQPSSQPFMVFTDGVKSWTRVTKLLSCGGWSRYSTKARWTSAFSAETISSTIVRIFCN